MFKEIVNYCEKFMKDNGDKRTENWFLIKSPITMLYIVGLYVIIVKIIGPKYMENRKPYNLNKAIQIYNGIQILLSGYVFFELLMVWRHYHFWKCNSVDYSDNILANRVTRAFYLYYLTKYTEFLDTIFFVLRKKSNQVSFLHVYHHGSMPVFVYIAFKFYAGGSISFPLLLNTFVHIVMYTYYFVAAMGPQYQKYLWWKKYITMMQLIQFTIGLIHFMTILYTPSSECNISKTFAIFYMGNGVFLTILFSNFYEKSYKKKDSTIKSEKNIFVENNNGKEGLNISKLKTKNMDFLPYCSTGIKSRNK